MVTRNTSVIKLKTQVDVGKAKDKMLPFYNCSTSNVMYLLDPVSMLFLTTVELFLDILYIIDRL